MTVGIQQIIATGNQDVFLSVTPEINVFKYVYYRYVNFANEIYKIHLNGLPSFNSAYSVTIPRYGHLLSKLYLHVKLPQLLSTEPNKYTSWCDTIGYAIFNSPIELLIGGSVVDRLYPESMDMLDELTTSSNKLGHDLMILKSDMYRDSIYNSLKPVDLIIPLNFWFCQNYALSLPLVSMTKQDIQINFSFKSFDKLINYNTSVPPNFVDIISADIFAEYIYLDDPFLTQFKSMTHQYVITQTIYNDVDIIPENTTFYSTKLEFSNPCKEIIFACTEKENILNNCYFNYSLRSNQDPIINQIKLMFENRNRYDISYLPECIFRQLFPNNVHSVVPTKHIYVIPFAIKPEDYQPTGAANLSRFNDVNLYLQLTPNNPECYLYVFALSYNVITIKDGILSFEWLN